MNPTGKQNSGLPPKRGAVKVQIFSSLADAVRSAASKAGEVLAMIGGGGSGGGGDASTSGVPSTPGSPPPSAYASDGDADQA